jgi:uncharacterized membrane protein YfcA
VPVEFLIAIPLGFGLGFVIGLTGVGGGALVAPALYVILGMGYAESVALSLIYSFFTKIFSAVQHLRQGTVLWRITLLYGLTGIPGSVLGSRVIYWGGGGPQRVFPFLMAGVLLLVSALMLMETGVQAIAAREKPFSPHRITWPGALTIGAFQLVVGALMGLTSIGSGSLVILSMVYLFRMSAREIIGSNIVIALIMVIPAGLTHYLAGGVDWRLLALLLVGSLGGAVLGSKATMMVPDRGLKLAIVALIVTGAVSTIVRAW